MKYQKRAHIIEAFLYNGYLKDEDKIWRIPNWAIDAYKSGILFFAQDELRVNTSKGDMVVNIGDYIILGAKGDLFPCKPDIFEKLYEKAV